MKICETGEEEGTVAEGGAKLGGSAAEDHFDRGMMLGFEQGEELDGADVTNLQRGIGEMLTCQLLDDLKHARAGRDGTTGEVCPIDGAVGMEHDAIDRVAALPCRWSGLLQDVVERVKKLHVYRVTR